MQIRKAELKDKVVVLTILDEFRTFMSSILSPGNIEISKTAISKGGNMYEELMNSDNYCAFIAKENDIVIGIVTIVKLPVLRKGVYRGEIEEIFVKPEWHGKNIALDLMNNAFEWCKENDIEFVNLEAAKEFERAHKFYSKVGFRDYGKAFTHKI